MTSRATLRGGRKEGRNKEEERDLFNYYTEIAAEEGEY